MATVSRYALFIRAFLITLIVGAPASSQGESTDPEDWARSTQIGTAEAYFWYLRRNPTGAYIDEALLALRDLGTPRRSATRGVAGGAAAQANDNGGFSGTSAGDGSSGGSGGGGSGGGGSGGGGSGGGGSGGGGSGGGGSGGGGSGGGGSGGGTY